jgi:ABC-type hemin transport system substrate-binding protein
VPDDFLPWLQQTGVLLFLVGNRGTTATAAGAERVVDELVQVKEGVDAADRHREWKRAAG